MANMQCVVFYGCLLSAAPNALRVPGAAACVRAPSLFTAISASDCVERAQFTYPFTSWQAIGLCPVFGYCEQHCYEHFVQVFVWTFIFFPLRVKLLCHVGTLWEVAKMPVVAPFYIPAMSEGFHFSTSSPTLAIVFSSPPSRYKVVSHFGFICISLMTDDVEHLFRWLLTICMSSLRTVSSNPLPILKNGNICFLLRL